MNEKRVIASILRNRSAWEKLKDIIEPSKEFSPEGSLLFGYAQDYYNNDEGAASCDLDLIKSRIEREVTSNGLSDLLVAALDSLPDVSAANVAREMLALRRHQLGQKLSVKLGLGESGPTVDKLLQQYTGMLAAESLDGDAELAALIRTGVSVENLCESAMNSDSLIHVWPEELNARLDGGVLRGHHLLILARPEMGKTLMSINMVAGFLAQGLKVLYIANEEPPEDILLRLGCRLSGMNKYEIRDRPAVAQVAINAGGANLFSIAPLAPGNFNQIEVLARRFLPDVVVLDQLRNIDARSDNRTEALENNAKGARNLAKRHNCLVVSITQAGDSATGKRVLGLGDVDGSNTGIPGAVDVIVAVGADDAMLVRNTRMISLPKNKRGGNHEPFTIQIDPQLSMVREAA